LLKKPAKSAIDSYSKAILEMSKGFHVLIPARLASTRLPNKPLADIGGAPMIVRVAQQVAKSQATSIVVAADDARVNQACVDAGIRCVLTRQDHISGTDRLFEAAELLGLEDDDIVVNVQGDEPFIEPELINAVANLLEADKSAAMSTAAHPIYLSTELNNSNIVKVVCDRDNNALYFSRACIPFDRDASGRVELPVLRHMGIYAYRVGFLKKFALTPPSPIEQLEMLEQLRALWNGYKIKVSIVQRASPAGVDTTEDLLQARKEWVTRQRLD
jgi:3-deoxy-manno-octulosonate cytidylyltransferase (CMP-KDO synthetase)